MILDEIIKTCHYLLNNAPEAQDYKTYVDSRISKEMQEFYQLGYFPPTKNLKLLTSLVDEQELKVIKLLDQYSFKDASSARTSYYNFFENNSLIMPYKDLYGNTIAIVGRTLLNDEERSEKGIQKYKNTVFAKKNHVFGLHEAKSFVLKEDCVYVVEGQFDVIKAREKGIYNIVAVGSSSLSSYQLSLLARYTKNIILLFDNDEGGIKGRHKATQKYREHVHIMNLYLPDPYKDIDEFLKENNKEDLRFTVKDAKYSF